MNASLYLPLDDFDGDESNFDLAADYIELSAFFSPTMIALTSDLINTSEIGAEEDYHDVNEEISTREEIVTATVLRIEKRMRALRESYPFAIDEQGTVVTFTGNALTPGSSAYLLCLILSHLKAVSPLMEASVLHPTNEEESLLRRYFQYCATAALAAEICGRAWSFGFPRPDNSGFVAKLEAIWGILRDGRVERSEDAPESPKDDQIDVFAARMHPDGQPGFLIAVAQVATGANWKSKSIKYHADRVFCERWFHPRPATDLVCYHIIPFVPSERYMPDHVRVLGNLLHRLRLPYRVNEAAQLAEAGLPIEAFDKVSEVAAWIRAFRSRALELA